MTRSYTMLLLPHPLFCPSQGDLFVHLSTPINVVSFSVDKLSDNATLSNFHCFINTRILWYPPYTPSCILLFIVVVFNLTIFLLLYTSKTCRT